MEDKKEFTFGEPLNPQPEVDTKKEPESSEEKQPENLNLQSFMDDMKTLGDQIRDKNLRKPAFHYGDLAVTNYLLWLMLGELRILNEKIGRE